jgi:hypothetical protein
MQEKGCKKGMQKKGIIYVKGMQKKELDVRYAKIKGMEEKVCKRYVSYAQKGVGPRICTVCIKIQVAKHNCG